MKNDKDAQFLCKDCVGFGQCEYYDRRKEDSYICKYFHLTETCEMTNGNVLKVLFPDLKYSIEISTGKVITMMCGGSSFDLKWWNAPYRKGGEE